jgi:hypothetical protein
MSIVILNLVAKLEAIMDANTPTRIRHIFLSPRPHFPLNTVAELLEIVG